MEEEDDTAAAMLNLSRAVLSAVNRPPPGPHGLQLNAPPAGGLLASVSQAASGQFVNPFLSNSTLFPPPAQPAGLGFPSATPAPPSGNSFLPQAPLLGNSSISHNPLLAPSAPGNAYPVSSGVSTMASIPNFVPNAAPAPSVSLAASAQVKPVERPSLDDYKEFFASFDEVDSKSGDVDDLVDREEDDSHIHSGDYTKFKEIFADDQEKIVRKVKGKLELSEEELEVTLQFKEQICIGDDVLVIPSVLLQKDVFNQVLSPDVWNELSEEEKLHLRQFLPPTFQGSGYYHLVERIFNRENFHFGTPLENIRKAFVSGKYSADVSEIVQEIYSLSQLLFSAKSRMEEARTLQSIRTKLNPSSSNSSNPI